MKTACSAALLAAFAATPAFSASCNAGRIDTSFGPSGSAGFVQISPWLPTPAGNFEGLIWDGDHQIYAPTTVATHAEDSRFAALVRVSNAGKIDRTYAGFGLASPGLQPGTRPAGDVARDNAGRSIVVLAGNGNVSVSRFNPDGTPDIEFGSVGSMSFALPNAFVIVGVATANDGSILISAGGQNTSAPQAQQPVVVKLTPAGVLDASFGTGGYAFFFPPAYAWPDALGRATDLALLPSGQILVTGRFRVLGSAGYHFQMFLARLQADGTLDASFGNAGYAIVDAGDAYDALGRKLAVQPDGKIVITGSVRSTDGTTSAVAVYRVNADGSLDTGFGSGGYTVTATGYGAFGIQLALQDNGKIVVGATHFTDPASTVGEPLVLRYLASGALDPAFGSAGVATITPAGPAAAIASSGGVSGVRVLGPDRIVAVFTGTTAEGTGAVFLTSLQAGRGRDCH